MKLTLFELIEIVMMFLNKRISMSEFRHLTKPYRDAYKKLQSRQGK